MTYPATNSNDASKLLIGASNQVHEVVNGTSEETVTTESGEIPTLRKAITDNFYFTQVNLPWDQGNDEVVFNQLREFNGKYYHAPLATVSNPIPMGLTPIGDPSWKDLTTPLTDLVTDAYNSKVAAEASASTAGYQGLWPDVGGNADKGETYQTQVGGVPTGKYYTALQNTTADPVRDNVNWKINISPINIITEYHDIASMVSSALIGEKCSVLGTKFTRVSDSNGDIYDFSPSTEVFIESFVTGGISDTDGFYSWIEYLSASGNCGASRGNVTYNIEADGRVISGRLKVNLNGTTINVTNSTLLIRHSGHWGIDNGKFTGDQSSYIIEPLNGWSAKSKNLEVSECRGFANCDDVGGRVFGSIEFLNCSGYGFQTWCLLQCGGFKKLKFKGGTFDNDGFESTANARVCYAHSGPSTATINDGIGDVFFDEVEVINLKSSNDAAEVQACQVNKAKRFFARDNTIIGLEKTGTTSGNCEGLYSQDLLFTRFKNNDVIDCECAQGSLVIKQKTKNAKISGGTIKPKVGGKLSNGIVVTNTSALDDRSVSIIDVDIIEPYGIGINVVTSGLQTGLTLNLTNNTITDWHGVSGIFINYGRECDLTCRNKLKTTRDTPTLTDNPIFGTIPSALTGVYGAVMIVVPADAAAETLINLEGNEIKAPTTTDYHGIVVYGVGSVSVVRMLYSNTAFVGVDSPVWWDIENSTLLGSDLYHKDCGNYTLKHNASSSMITGLGFGYGTVNKVATITTGQLESSYLSRDEKEVTTFDSGWTVSQTSGTPVPHKLDLTTGQVRVVIDSPATENLTFNIQKQTDIRRTISATS